MLSTEGLEASVLGCRLQLLLTPKVPCIQRQENLILRQSLSLEPANNNHLGVLFLPGR